MKRLMPALGAMLLTLACESNLPTAPTAPAAVPPPWVAVAPTGSGPTPIPGTDAVVGRAFEGIVGDGDPFCFPNWDASARCRQFNLTPTADGTLVATLKWPGPYGQLIDPDVFLVAPDGVWRYAPYGEPEKSVTLPVKGGLSYRIVVMSYIPTPQAFSLVTQLQ